MKRPFYPKIMYTAMAVMFVVFAISCKNTDHNLATVITAEISDKTASSAKGGGEVTEDGGTPVTKRGVCWSTSQNPTTADKKTTDGEGTGVFTSELQDLSPDEVYYVRAYATNSAGTAYGSGVSFIADSTSSGKGNFTDVRDGHGYRTQIIGSQTWMAENLAYLPSVSGPETGSGTLPYYYVYEYDSTIVATAKDSANYKTYGVLYNWPAAMESCPAGWHLPSEAEWKKLIETIGSPAGGKLKETGTTQEESDTTHWLTPNTGATNAFDFDAIPGGERYSLGGFRYISTYAVFWSSEIRDAANTWAWHLHYDNNRIERDWFNNGNGFSVRCLKD